MPTISLPTGQLARMLVGTEATFKTAAAADGYKPTYFYSETLAERTPIEQDPILGGSANNDRDETAPAPSLGEHGGQVVVPLCLNHFGLWLKHAFGAPSTSGSTNKTHVFASGAAQLPTYTIEAKRKSDDFRQHLGLAQKSFRIEASDKAGFHRVTLELVGAKENFLGSSAAGTPIAAMALSQVPATKGIVRINSVAAGYVMAADFGYETGVGMERYVDDDDGFSAAVLFDRAAATGSLKMRYADRALEDLAKARTPQPLEIEFSLGVNNSILFAMPSATLQRTGAPISGPGGIEQDIGFRAAQTSGAPMMTVTLKNQIASY